MGTINPEVWPVLRNLPASLREKATLAAVSTYEVNGRDQPHAIIHCSDKTTHYVGSSIKFGDCEYTMNTVN